MDSNFSFIADGLRIATPAEAALFVVAVVFLLTVIVPGATPALVARSTRRKRCARAVIGRVLAGQMTAGSFDLARWPVVAGFVGRTVCSVGVTRAITGEPPRARRWASATTAMGQVLLLATVGICVFQPSATDAQEAA